jgi:hypothetical protein
MKNAEQLLEDPVIRDVRDRVAREARYCRSIVVMGSRAQPGEPGLSPFQDYDIVAVTPTLMTPFALSRLRKIGTEVASHHSTHVSLNPLPALRLRFCDGNYMLLKLGAEGVVIHGEDVLPRLRRIQPGDIQPWWRFFFLASQARRLLKVAPAAPTLTLPRFTGEGACSFPSPVSRGRVRVGAAGDQVAYHAAKAILGCAEVMALRAGAYTTDPNSLHDILVAEGHPEFASEVKLADDVLRRGVQSRGEPFDSAQGKLRRTMNALSPGKSNVPESPAQLWHRARARLLDTLDILSADHLKAQASDRARFARAFLSSGGPWSVVRDLQFVALALMGRRRLHLRALLYRRGVAERVKLALFWLLEACGSDGSPDSGLLEETRRHLSGAIRLPPPAAGWDEWKALLDAVEAYYPHACVALGV